MQIDLDSLPRGASFVNLWQRAVGVAKATSAGVPAVFSGSYYLDQENPGGCKTYAWQQARAAWLQQQGGGSSSHLPRLLSRARSIGWR